MHKHHWQPKFKLNSALKIAFIVDVFPNLTSDTFILNQITGLIDRGCEVDIFARTAQSSSKLQPDVQKYNLLDHTFYFNGDLPGNIFQSVGKRLIMTIQNFHKNPGALLKALNVFEFGKEAYLFRLPHAVIPFLDKGPYDVINCHFGPNGNVGVLLKMLGVVKTKVVTTFHSYDIVRGMEEGPAIYDRLFRQGDLFLSICDYNYKKLTDFGLKKQKIVYHPVGIDLDKFPFKWQGQSPTAGKPVTVITVARLVVAKALDNGIKAIHKVVREHPDLDLEYNIVGEGYLKEDLKGLINDLNLNKIVRLLGPKTQDVVADMLKQSDIFLLPSRVEATPVVLMEAQAVGLPVIATDVASVKEVIVDNKSGYCVPSMDIDALAEKLNYLIACPEKWFEMGKIGRKHIEDNFDVNKLNDRLLNIFSQLINDKFNPTTHFRQSQMNEVWAGPRSQAQ